MLDDCELMLTIYSGNCQRRPDSLSQTASEFLDEGGVWLTCRNENL